MYLEKITLHNFKAYEKLEFNCNKNFNIIIGENNIGKSTLFDALLLWNLIYLKLIKKKRKKEFYTRNSQNTLRINFSEFLIFRLVNTKDLFLDSTSPAIINLTIRVHGSRNYDLAVEIKNIADSYFTFNTTEDSHFKEFSDMCLSKNIKLPDAIKIKVTKPISSLLRKEPFLNKAQIVKKTYLGFSQDVLRNKILATMEDRKFNYLQNKLEKILNKHYILRFKNNNKDDDENIDMTIKQGEEGKEVDLLLIGSGVLHVLEIFSTMNSEHENEDSVNLLLLDEPDSHIHADIQSKLIDELKEEKNSQTFLITHNDRLMQKATNGELYYICKDTVDNQVLDPLSIDDYKVVKNGLSKLFDIDNKKPILLLEGKTDKKILTIAWKKLYKDDEMPYNLISPGTDTPDINKMSASADSVRQALQYASTFIENKMIGIFDNDTAGRREFKGLKQNIFQKYVENKIVRKHVSKDVWGLCLPVPNFRSQFITVDSIEDSHFVIEHYFINETLIKYEMKGRNILGSDVFRIKGDKNKFSSSIADEEKEVFRSFKFFFEKINNILANNEEN